MHAFPKARQGGVLLIEVLIALALFLAISTIIAQALSVGFAGEKTSRSRTLAMTSLNELLTQVRASSEEHWDNIAALVKGAPYSINVIGGHLVVATGSSPVVIDGVTYQRSFSVQAASRTAEGASSQLAIATSAPGRTDQGSLVVDGQISWGTQDMLTLRTIITRWRNIVCGQTSWSATSTNPAACTTANIALPGKANIQAGDTLTLCSGC